MKPRHFLSQLRHEQIVQAIQQAEQQTSGEIRVFISRRMIRDPVAAAQKQFRRLKMDRTAQRNAVLLLVAPRSQRFAIIGDEGIHRQVGDETWRKIAEEMAAHLRDGNYTGALLRAIQRSGELLAKHFPHQKDDRNELPDAPAHD